MADIEKARRLLALGALLRLGIGAGYLFVPERMAGRLAPDIRGHADGRMSTRGFGALHCGVALATLRGAIRGNGCQDLALLNLACAIGDTTATFLERHDRGQWERAVLGSVPIDILDVAWWLNASRLAA